MGVQLMISKAYYGRVSHSVLAEPSKLYLKVCFPANAVRLKKENQASFE
jgi:hypothetical protein